MTDQEKLIEIKIKKFAHDEVVCRGCGYIIRKEGYVEIDGKAYHKKCADKVQEEKLNA